jgi:hypothetical protein
MAELLQKDSTVQNLVLIYGCEEMFEIVHDFSIVNHL